MPDMYGFAVNEEEFVALINELLGKTTPKVDKKAEQANARAALSDIWTDESLAEDLVEQINIGRRAIATYIPIYPAHR